MRRVFVSIYGLLAFLGYSPSILLFSSITFLSLLIPLSILFRINNDEFIDSLS